MFWHVEDHYWYYYEQYDDPEVYDWSYEDCYGDYYDAEDDYGNGDSKGHYTCEDDAGYK